MGSQPGTDRAAAQPRLLLAQHFGADEITKLRHEVTARAAGAGLGGEALDDFIVAVNELVTNAVRHGGGRGVLHMWHLRDTVTCEVNDAGPGITEEADRGRSRPSPRAAGGWGLWLARRLSSGISIDTGPDGTTVRISASTTGRPAG